MDLVSNGHGLHLMIKAIKSLLQVELVLDNIANSGITHFINNSDIYFL